MSIICSERKIAGQGRGEERSMGGGGGRVGELPVLIVLIVIVCTACQFHTAV